MCGHFPMCLLVKTALVEQGETKGGIVSRMMDVALAPTVILQFPIHAVTNSTRNAQRPNCHTCTASAITLCLSLPHARGSSPNLPPILLLLLSVPLRIQRYCQHYYTGKTLTAITMLIGVIWWHLIDLLCQQRRNKKQTIGWSFPLGGIGKNTA